MCDASGRPLSVSLNGTTYYYVTNLQGDVTAILNSSGTAVVNYTYDAWGNLQSVSGTLASTLGEYNPLRYRGYVYDTETGFYYLQSRYYDPQIGRFINADALVSTGQGLLGNNMFAYCLNNPIVYSDYIGTAAAVAFSPFVYERDGVTVDDITTGGGGVSATLSAALTVYFVTIISDRVRLDAALKEKLKQSGGTDRIYIVYFLKIPALNKHFTINTVY